MIAKTESLFSIATSLVAICGIFADRQKTDGPNITVNIFNAGHNNTFNIGKDDNPDKDSLRQLNDSLQLIKAQLELEKTKYYLHELRESGKWNRIK